MFSICGHGYTPESAIVPCIEFIEQYTNNMKVFFEDNIDIIDTILYGN